MIQKGLKIDPCPRCGLKASELTYRDEYTFCPRCWLQFNFKLEAFHVHALAKE